MKFGVDCGFGVVKDQCDDSGELVTIVTHFSVMLRTTDTILLLSTTTACHMGECAVGAADHEEAALRRNTSSPAVLRGH
jgi:hypothetical protein